MTRRSKKIKGTDFVTVRHLMKLLAKELYTSKIQSFMMQPQTYLCLQSMIKVE